MHSLFMLAALDEAKRFQGYCAPNPSVGAVAVKGQTIIGRAAHQGAGAAHAEINLLNQLEGDLSDVTLYITLEPCNHWGRTPPCVQKIIERKVGALMYGYADPNPVVRKNNTPKILTDNGIKVRHYPTAEVDQFYRSYQFWTQHRRPWVTAKMAISLDGKIALSGNRPFALSNPVCQQATHRSRLDSDIILTTSNTILADDPFLNVRIDGDVIAKPLAILDRHLRVPSSANAIHAAKKVIQFHKANADVRQVVSSEHFAVSENPAGLNLDDVFRILGELGYHDVWVEAGGALFSYLHLHKLVQTTYLYVTPHILGNQAVPAFHHMADWLQHNPQMNWQVASDNAILQIEWV